MFNDISVTTYLFGPSFLKKMINAALKFVIFQTKVLKCEFFFYAMLNNLFFHYMNLERKRIKNQIIAFPLSKSYDSNSKKWGSTVHLKWEYYVSLKIKLSNIFHKAMQKKNDVYKWSNLSRFVKLVPYCNV